MMMEVKRLWAPRWTGACLMAALAVALLVPVQRVSAATCSCPADTNSPFRLSEDECPQVVGDTIDVANTDPNNPLVFPVPGGGTLEVTNPYWDDPGGTQRAAGKSMVEANVNIMELFACDDALCVGSCDESRPNTLYRKEGTIFRVYVRQRCLLQQRLDQSGNPVEDKTAPLCVRGYQVWLRFDADLLEMVQIRSAPEASDASCIPENSPFRSGIAGFSLEEANPPEGQPNGLAFAAAGIESGACPTADDAVIAWFEFRVKSGNGNARVEFAKDRISGSIADPFTTTATQWTKDEAGSPVLPNLKDQVTVYVDNTAPAFVRGEDGKCSLLAVLPVECGRGNGQFSNDFTTDITPDRIVAEGDAAQENLVIPDVVDDSSDPENALTCLTYEDTIIPLCGHQFDAKRIWTLTDCAGNSATCEVQVITVRDTTPPESLAPEIEVSCAGDIPAPMATDMNSDFVLDPMEFSMIGVQANADLVTQGILWDRCGQVSARFAGDFSCAPDSETGAAPTDPDCRISATALDVCDPDLPCPNVIWRLYVAEDACTPTDTINVWMKISIVRKDGPTLVTGTHVANVDSFADALTASQSDGRGIDGCSAMVDLNLISPRATDACGCPLNVENEGVTGIRDDERNLNDPFPEGCTTVTWTIMDCDGNELKDGDNNFTTTVCVEPFNIVVADVEYGIATELDEVHSPFVRCITMRLSSCADSTVPTVEQETLMSFEEVGRRTRLAGTSCDSGAGGGTIPIHAAIEAKFLVPCGVYDCVTARDILHTLTAKATMGEDPAVFEVDTSVKPWRYKVSFTGIRPEEVGFCAALGHDDPDDPYTKGNRLVVGNLNDDTFIDIDDFGIFSAALAIGAAAPTASCEIKPFHADVVPDTIIQALDFGVIATNFLRVSERPCCVSLAVAGATAGPRTSVTVAQLREEGKAALAAGDLNGDGVLDVADMEAFAAGVRPVLVAGDLDADGDVDMADYMAFQACFTGNGDASDFACLSADLDGDGDVDLADLVGFQASFTGSQ